MVIASGETERRAIPCLVEHLRDQGISVDEIRVPPHNRPLDVEMAEKLIKAVWYENLNSPPDKLVLLVDVDRAVPEDVLDLIRRQLPQRLGPEIGTRLQYAYAQWHLEAWYFADIRNLRSYLGESPGLLDTSLPDEIENPKRRLQALLRRANRVYTARVSEEIARHMHAPTIAQRSPSFRGFLEAVMNGDLSVAPRSAGVP